MRNFVLIIFILLSCQDNKKFEILKYSDFKKKIESSDVILIDVRTPMEFSQGHIQGSVNVDFKEEKDFQNYFENLDKSETIFLYCRSGNRSRKSAEKLIDLGFNKIYDLDGGFIEWNLNELKKINP
tara:strand:+ start:124 stop:501 length:378 start_codon:yes stop_codon:yes gene_type:complete